MSNASAVPLISADSMGGQQYNSMVPYQRAGGQVGQRSVEPLFSKFLQQWVMQGRFPEDSQKLKAARLALQVAAVFFATSAQAGMVNVNFQAAGNNEALGGMFATSNLATFCVFNSYNSCVLLNELMRTWSPEEQVLFLSSIPPWVRNSLKVVAAIVGAGSQLPIAYAAYDANNESLFYFAMRFLDSGVPIRSLYLSGEAIYAQRHMSDVEKKLVETNGNFCQLLAQAKEMLPLLNGRSRDQVQAILEKHNGPVDAYLRALVELAPEPEVQGLGYKAVRKVVSGGGYLSTFAVMAIYWVLSYAAIGLISDDETFKIIGATVVMLCNYYLWKDAISQTATQALDTTKQLIQRQYKPSIAESFLPKTSAALTTAGVALAVFTYGPNDLFSHKYFGGSDVGAGLVEVFSSIGSAFLAQWTFSTFNKGMMEAGLARWGSEDAKDVISIDRQLDRIRRTAENISIQSWAEFLVQLPEDLKKKVLGSVELSDQEIRDYLRVPGSATVEEIADDEDLGLPVSAPSSVQEVEDVDDGVVRLQVQDPSES